MKKILTSLVLCSATIPAFATLTLYDPFNYSVGSIDGQSPGAGQTWVLGKGATQPAIQVVGTGLSVSGLAPSSGGALELSKAGNSSARVGFGTSFAPPSTSGEVGAPLYYSLAFKVTDLTGVTSTTTGAFYFGFNNLITSGTATFATYGTKLFVLQGSDSSHFKIGLGKNNYNGGSGVNPEATDATQEYALGDTIFVVGSYTQVGGGGNANGAGNDNPIKLWVNPNPSTFNGASEATAGQTQSLLQITSSTAGDIGAATGSPQIMSFAVREMTATPALVIDELRVGTTWADVTPVPEPAMIGLALLAGGFIAFRRSRAQA